MATSGAQGLVDKAVICPGRAVCTTGWQSTFSGIAGGPSGLPMLLGADNARLGFFLIDAFEPAVSRAPCSIHFLIKSSFASGSLSVIGGISGFSEWLTRAHIRELARSPASTTSPLLPPVMAF